MPSESPRKLETPIGMHDGHIDAYRRIENEVRVDVRTWTEKIVEFEFKNPVFVRDVLAIDTDLEMVIEVFDGPELDEARSAMRELGSSVQEIESARLFRFINLDNEAILSIVAESVLFWIRAE